MQYEYAYISLSIAVIATCMAVEELPSSEAVVLGKFCARSLRQYLRAWRLKATIIQESGEDSAH